jgi:hypothetical protein
MKLIFRALTGFTLTPVILFSFTLCQFLLFALDSFGISANNHQCFGKSIIDYRQHLNPAFKKIKRGCTRYIIVHTSESDLETTLKIVSKGKQDNWLTAHHSDNSPLWRIINDQAKAILMIKGYLGNSPLISGWLKVCAS